MSPAENNADTLSQPWQMLIGLELSWMDESCRLASWNVNCHFGSR